MLPTKLVNKIPVKLKIDQDEKIIYNNVINIITIATHTSHHLHHHTLLIIVMAVVINTARS